MPSKLVGIVNYTPDSFSDGGCYDSVDEALAHVASLLQAGAYVIDIGAESTRPGAVVLTADEEIERLKPMLESAVGLTHAQDGLVSVDTYHAKTADYALSCGVDWINDVSGGDDPEMLRVLASSNARFVVMHHLGIPADKSVTLGDDIPVIDAVMMWLTKRIEMLSQQGINATRIIADPGIGFGKTAEQSWEIIRHVDAFLTLGVDIMVGHSRKSFLKNVAGDDISLRDQHTLALSKDMSAKGVDFLRVHNVASHQSLG